MKKVRVEFEIDDAISEEVMVDEIVAGADYPIMNWRIIDPAPRQEGGQAIVTSEMMNAGGQRLRELQGKLATTRSLEEIAKLVFEVMQAVSTLTQSKRSGLSQQHQSYRSTISSLDELREAAKLFYNLTIADPTVILRANSFDKRESIVKAGAKLQEALIKTGKVVEEIGK